MKPIYKLEKFVRIAGTGDAIGTGDVYEWQPYTHREFDNHRLAFEYHKEQPAPARGTNRRIAEYTGDELTGVWSAQ